MRQSQRLKILKETNPIKNSGEVIYNEQVVTIKTISDLPAEVLDLIFEKLEDFQDSLNITKVCQQWKTIILSSTSRPLWMFALVIQGLFHYLTRKDILNCRLVCKQWTTGVDNFLEDNSVQRPGSTKNENALRKMYSFGIPNYFLWSPLHYRGFLSYQGSYHNLLAKAKTHPRSPIIGRSIYLIESILDDEEGEEENYDDDDEEPVPNKQFLQAFGQHIWFMDLSTIGLSVIQHLNLILDWLQYTPNLKTIQINACLYMPSAESSDVYIESQEQQVLTFLQEWRRGSYKKFKFKLETLTLSGMNGIWGELCRVVLLEMLTHDNLKSLEMESVKLGSVLTLPRLTNFAFHVEHDSDFEALKEYIFPVKYLRFTFQGKNVRADLIFQAVSAFQSTLCTMRFGFLQEFYENGGFHNLQYVEFQGFPSPSLNFLCGLKNSLQYLYIEVENIGKFRRFYSNIFTRMGSNEELDLLSLVGNAVLLRRLNVTTLYKSNVWELFPRLKVLILTFKTRHEDRSGSNFECRRDVYEKYITASDS